MSLQVLVVTTDDGVSIFSNSHTRVEVDLTILHGAHSEDPDPDEEDDAEPESVTIERLAKKIQEKGLRCIGGYSHATAKKLLPS